MIPPESVPDGGPARVNMHRPTTPNTTPVPTLYDIDFVGIASSEGFGKVPGANPGQPGSVFQDGASSEGSRPLRDVLGLPTGRTRSVSSSPLRLSMPTITPGQLAFSALQYLPVPTLVLNNLKTVVLANEAMGRMMGLISDETPQDHATAAIDHLRGQTLSQVGIDMLQDGRPVWIAWESFLDGLVGEVGIRPPANELHHIRSSQVDRGDATPTVGTISNSNTRRSSSPGQLSQDAVVEVVISRQDISKTTFDSRYKSKESDYQAFAKMIITVWEVEDKQTFFTLTFTNTQSTPSNPPNNKKPVAKPNVLEAADRRTIGSSNPSSVASSRESGSPSFHSPGVVTMSSSPFPPMGPPSIASHSSSPSLLQKIIMMKDALLDNTQMPILAIWKDGSVTFPNKAARQLLSANADLDTSSDGFELLKNWDMWTEDFSRKLDVSEYPISILLRTESPFPSMRVGMIDHEGKRIVYDMLGEAIRDDATGEFLAGVVTGRDVTVMTEEISQIKERDYERFKIICDTMPQLVWTASPDGMHDFFNTRWYSYTGLKPKECLGVQWQMPFHPDDRPEALARWKRSMETGDPYVMEYRCRSSTGEWRWFLGRALAVRNKESGEIEKWFGKAICIFFAIANNADIIIRYLHRRS